MKECRDDNFSDLAAALTYRHRIRLPPDQKPGAEPRDTRGL
ncbi:hypothetical protein [Streptomyces sp.]